ncbi:hypothetical protein BC332_14104 [Capsicum chinense]|nr:hypothetical protein BC332_14104 [Capsicum chinense]
MLQLCYYISDGFNAEMSCISYEVHDLVQSLFHQSGDDMLVKLKDHVVPRLLENIDSCKISDHHFESSATMTDDQLVELLDALLVNLHYLPKVHAELLLPSRRTQYELLQNVFGNLRDFHDLIINGCIERKTIECVLPQFQLTAERVGHFCFVLLSYQLDKTDEKDVENEDDEDEDEEDEEEDEDEDEDEENEDDEDEDEEDEDEENEDDENEEDEDEENEDDEDEEDQEDEDEEEDEDDENDENEEDEDEENEDDEDEEDKDEDEEEDEDEEDEENEKNEEDEYEVYSMLVHLLLKIISISLEVMHICSTNLKASKSAEVGRFIKQLLQASPDILREYLIHLQQHMINAITPSTSARNIHVMIEFLLIILTDVSKDIIRQDKLFVLLECVGALIREVSIFIRNLEENSMNEENMKKISRASPDLLENIELLKKDLKHVFLEAPADSCQLCFPMSDGPLFMTLLLRNLNDFLNSNADSVVLIEEENQLDVAYEAEHAINSILARDRGLFQLIFLLPNTIEKIKLVKKEVQEKITKNTSINFANSHNTPVENKLSIASKIIIGFEEETEWIIRKLTSGPSEVDVISIVGMPGLGKTTLAYRVYNDKSVIGHFDVRAWCTIDPERNEKKLLQKIFNQVIGLKGSFNEDRIDNDVADKLRKHLFGKRYLIVLDDLWDTATWDELTTPLYTIPSEFHKGSRVILTSRKNDVALHGKCHSAPLDLRLLRPEESWELLEKRVFGEDHCPDELKDVGEKIAQKCDGLPLVLDLIGGVISRKEKKEALWLEVLNNLSSFIFKDEEEVMKVIQLSYGHLSDHLKPCFLYLASYPKDEDIDISLLKHLWSNEGLVEPNDLKSVEEVTEVYVDELISSSLVIVRGDIDQPANLENLFEEHGKEWNMEQVTFHNLKSLALFEVFFLEWQATADESFPVLEELEIRYCAEILEIPESFGDIASLKSIVVWESPRAEELALKMKKYIEEITGEDRLDVQFCYIPSIMAPKIDQSDPLFIGASDSSSVVLVPIKEEVHEQWETCNAIVLSWIMNTVSESLLYGIVYATNGCAVWEDLKERYQKVNRMHIYQLHHEINMYSQGTNSISAYFNKLKSLWSEYDVLVPNSSCDCPKSREYSDHMCQLRLLQLLSGLNESYDQARRQILLKGVTPTFNQAYAMLIEDEIQHLACMMTVK